MALVANVSALADTLIADLASEGAFVGDTGDVYKDKVHADIVRVWTLILGFIAGNAEVSTALSTSLNTVFTNGVPVPTDGGTALQTAWKAGTAAGAADNATGTIT